MHGETEERWRRLCEQAVHEKDPDKLMQLTQEISRLLEQTELLEHRNVRDKEESTLSTAGCGSGRGRWLFQRCVSR
jgi:hypothetical protein